MRTKRAFEVKLKAFFIIFKWLSVAKNRLRPESAPLIMLIVLSHRKSWTIDAWFQLLDSGRLDSGRLDAWTLDAWSLETWTLGLWTLGLCRLNACRIFTTTAEYWKFYWKFPVIINFHRFIYRKNFIDKVNRNLKS